MPALLLELAYVCFVLYYLVKMLIEFREIWEIISKENDMKIELPKYDVGKCDRMMAWLRIDINRIIRKNKKKSSVNFVELIL